MPIEYTCCSTAGQPLFSIAQMLEGADPFFIGHRGAADVMPEHTMTAYAYGIEQVQAIEVSTCRTSDGVFICMHDLNTDRVTGVNHQISSTPWSVLQDLDVDMRGILGPNAPVVPITPLEEVLDAFAGKYVIFLEDKQGTNTTELLDLMDQYPNATETFVWKTFRDGGAAAAQARGYQVWGYLDDDDPNLAAVAAAVDMLGASTSSSDAWYQQVVAEGLPVITWPVHRRVERDRAFSNGVRGMMAANLPYLLDDEPAAQQDNFPTGVRRSGDLPYDMNDSSQPAWQPAWILADGEYVMELDFQFGVPYSLGSLGPNVGVDYALEVELRFPVAIPSASQHVGFVFGRTNDSAYRFNTGTGSGGYHMLLRGSGAFQLYRHEPNVASGTQLANTATPAPVPGEWIPFRVEVTAGQITATRLDTATSINSTDTNYRGGYVHVSRNYDNGLLDFRNVRWEAL